LTLATVWLPTSLICIVSETPICRAFVRAWLAFKPASPDAIVKSFHLLADFELQRHELQVEK
jgi:hypothetical protein